MKTDYTDHWPTCRSQLDAGLPGGHIRARRKAITTWAHWLALGVGFVLIIGGLLS